MIFIIALIPALLVFIVSQTTKSRIATLVAAIIAALVGIMTGNPTFMGIDLLLVAIAVWLSFVTLPTRAPPVPKVPPPEPAGSSSENGSGFVWIAVIAGGLWFALSGPSKQTTPSVRQGPITQPAQPSAMPQVEQPHSASHNTNRPSYNSPSAQSPQPAPKRQVASADNNKLSEHNNLKLYEAALRKLEADHPELNPDLPGYREDLVRLILERIKVHERSGYPRHKALEMAAFDVGMDPVPTEAAPIPVAAKPAPKRPSIEDDPTYGLDKGNHSGFASNCRWVTSSVWSCQ